MMRTIERAASHAFVIGFAFAMSACGGATSSSAAPKGSSSGAPDTSAGASASGHTPAASATSATPSPEPLNLPPATALGSRRIATIDGVGRPCAMAADAHSVFVTGSSPSTVARISPRTNTVVKIVPLPATPCGIAIGDDGRVWVTLYAIGSVIALDPATLETTARLDGLGTVWDLKAGFGSIWAADRGKSEVVRIDPGTAQPIAHIAVGSTAAGLAIADGSVWVADAGESILRRIDPKTNAVVAMIQQPRPAVWLSNDDATIVAADNQHGYLMPVDPRANVTGTPRIGMTAPLDGTVSDGRVWMPDGLTRQLVELDVSTLAVRSVDDLDGMRQPFVVEPAFGSIWVLDFGGTTIARIQP